MGGQDTTLEQRAELRQRLGLDDPFLVQYGRFLANAAQGDFGISYRHRRPVAELIAERVPATLELSLVAAALALFVGVPRSEEHTSELQSLMRISYAVFCLKKKN